MRLAGSLTYLQRRAARRAAQAHVAAQYARDVEALRNLELTLGNHT